MNDEKYNITGCIKSNSVHNFMWEVDNFSQRHFKRGQCTYSPISDNIFVKSNGLRMKMVPLKPDSSKIGFRFLILRNESFCGLELFKIAFSNIHGEIYKEKSFKSHVSSFRSSICGFEDIWMDSILSNKKINLVNDTLRISCYFNINPRILDSADEKVSSNDPELTLNNCSFSDVTVVVGKNKFELHKAILSGKSKVFSTMFKQDVEESSTKVIEIKDIPYDVMKEVFRFIYCGKVENLQKFPSLLIEAAEKFDLKELKHVCEKFLQKNICVKDCCEMLQIADSYKCENLKSAVIDFAARHLDLLLEMDDFEKLTKYPQYLKMIIKKSNSQKNEENSMIIE